MRNRMIALVAAFLLGLIPMWILAYNRGSEKDRALQELKAVTLRDTVAAAALYGKRGEYERSRQLASQFFGDLRSKLESTQQSAPEHAVLSKIMLERDDVITLLARNDPAGVERLFQIEYQVRQAPPGAIVAN